MALFNKDSAKEKVKEFTGGFSLSQDFKNKLEFCKRVSRRVI